MIIMMIFNMSTSYSHKFSFPYFEGLFDDKTNLRVRYLLHIKFLLCNKKQYELHDVPKYCACWDLSLPSGPYPRY
jgi:hypothetical protein